MIKKKEKKRKMIKIGKFLVYFILIFYASFSFAEAQSKVQATVDRDQMGLGDSFTLTIRVQSNEDFEGQEPHLPTLNQIELLNAWADGKSSSTRMSFINGQSSYTKSITQDFHFMLSPKKEGQLIIPVIDVLINGKTFKTQPLKIAVGEQYRGGQQQQPRNRVQGRAQLVPGFDDPQQEDPFGDDNDPFAQLMKEKERIFDQLRRGGFGAPGAGGGFGNGFGGPTQPIPQKKLDINTNEAFFVYLDVDRKEAYEGQQITANWYIYVKGDILSLDRAKFPDLKGFWKEIIEEVPSLQFSPEIVNGIPYQKSLLASHALFPIKAGTATIDEFNIKAKTRMPGGQAHEWTKVSKRLPIKVLPLPLEGKPQNFSGAVGSFQVSIKSEGLQFPVQQPFSVKVRFEGSGNAKLIDLPNIPWPASLEVFDTKSESKFFKNGQSFKEFEILLVPRKEGEVIIPAFEFSHFDPEQKKYVTTMTEPLKLIITPGTGAPAAQSKNNSGAKDDLKNELSLQAQPQIEIPESSLWIGPVRWNIYLGLFALAALALLISFYQKFRTLNFEPALGLITAKKMGLLQQNLQAANFRQVGVEGVNLIYLLAAYLSGQKSANQEWLEVTEKIPIQLKDKYLTSLASSFEYFQMLGFAPEAVHQSLVASKGIEAEIEKLKKLSGAITDELKSQERE